MRLVVYLTTPERLRQCAPNPNPMTVPEFGIHGSRRLGLEDYGDDWAKFYPTDIVMLVEDELEFADCKHCGENIYEDPEAMLHRWKHVREGSYLCWKPAVTETGEFTQAEPKE